MVGAGNRAALGIGVEGGKIAVFEKLKFETETKATATRRKKIWIFGGKKTRFCLTYRFAADKIESAFHRNVELIDIVDFF